MVNFNDFQIEVDNNTNNQPENRNGSVTTSVTTLTPNTTRKITKFYICNPAYGPNANGNNNVLLFSTDNVLFSALGRGESFAATTFQTSLFIKSQSGTVNYEVILWS